MLQLRRVVDTTHPKQVKYSAKSFWGITPKDAADRVVELDRFMVDFERLKRLMFSSVVFATFVADVAMFSFQIPKKTNHTIDATS